MNRNTKQNNREEDVSKSRLPDAADPRDGVRLIKAFLEIKEPAWREELIRLAVNLAKASSDCLGTTEIEENHKRSAGGDAVDGSQVVDYEFRHDDGRADELPSDRVRYFSPQRIPRSAQALRHCASLRSSTYLVSRSGRTTW